MEIIWPVIGPNLRRLDPAEPELADLVIGVTAVCHTVQVHGAHAGGLRPQPAIAR